MKIKKYLWAICYGALLAAFSVYVLLDTFVIVRVLEPEATEAPSVQTTLPQLDTPVITENSYRDSNISITLTQRRVGDTTVYIADVQLAAPEYLRTALAKGSYGRNVTQKTSEIAAGVDAILAINGDFYGAREAGYVIRNGKLYRSEAMEDREDLVIGADGNFSIIEEEKVSADALFSSGARQVLSFGPALVVDGKIAVAQNEEVDQAMRNNPRTAIAQVGPLHYLLVVSDGRTKESQGLSLYELAHFLTTLDVQTAYNLDGGGSATMVFMGKVINNPTTNGKTIKERSVSDIVCIGY
ncbi:MAG: phosphodiester glycosidase family protein [Oscillospiraceae bacterium]|nr:phosphodiester glycosidase family protein [Oscillospiraceae bacterium]